MCDQHDLALRQVVFLCHRLAGILQQQFELGNRQKKMTVDILAGTHLSIRKPRSLSVTSSLLTFLGAPLVSLGIGKWKQDYLS